MPGLVGDLLLLIGGSLGGPLAFRDRSGIGLLGDQLVDVSDQRLNSGLLLFEFALAILALQQLQDPLHLLDDGFLAADGVPQLLTLQEQRQLTELIGNQGLLALGQGPFQQVRPIGIGLAEVLLQLLQRVLKPLVAQRQRVLPRCQRGRGIAPLGFRGGRFRGRRGLRPSRSRDSAEKCSPADQDCSKNRQPQQGGES